MYDVITIGSNTIDAFVYTDKAECFDYDNNHYVIYPMNIKIVETTGAGDSFSSTFLAGFIKTRDIEFSLKIALVNPHSVLKYKGAKNKLLTFEEAVQLLSASNIKSEKQYYCKI